MNGDVVRLGDGATTLVNGGGFWSGELPLPGWARYTRGRTGKVFIEIDRSMADEGADHPTAAQLAGCDWLLANEGVVLPVVLAAVVDAYSTFRARSVGRASGRAPDAALPATIDVDALAAMIDLRTLCVHAVSNGTSPYIGFLFGCTWDPEHGLGVLAHGLRVVEVGGADTAILEWIPKQDAQQSVGSTKRVPAKRVRPKRTTTTRAPTKRATTRRGTATSATTKRARPKPAKRTEARGRPGTGTAPTSNRARVQAVTPRRAKPKRRS